MRVLKLNLCVLSVLALASCSDPTVAPAEAAFKGYASPRPAEACGVAGPANFGTKVPTSARDEGATVRDGVDGAFVSCSIKGTGPYTVQATAGAQGASFSLAGTVGADGNGTLTNVTIISPTVGTLTNKEPCTIDASPAPGAGETLRIAPGEMFAQIDCPYMANAGTPDVTHCQALANFVLLKSCAK